MTRTQRRTGRPLLLRRSTGVRPLGHHREYDPDGQSRVGDENFYADEEHLAPSLVVEYQEMGLSRDLYGPTNVRRRVTRCRRKRVLLTPTAGSPRKGLSPPPSTPFNATQEHGLGPFFPTVVCLLYQTVVRTAENGGGGGGGFVHCTLPRAREVIK